MTCDNLKLYYLLGSGIYFKDIDEQIERNVMTSILGIIQGGHHLTTISIMISASVSESQGSYNGMTLEITGNFQEAA